MHVSVYSWSEWLKISHSKEFDTNFWFKRSRTNVKGPSSSGGMDPHLLISLLYFSDASGISLQPGCRTSSLFLSNNIDHHDTDTEIERFCFDAFRSLALSLWRMRWRLAGRVIVFVEQVRDVVVLLRCHLNQSIVCRFQRPPDLLHHKSQESINQSKDLFRWPK